jgi:hypothetical protein
MSESKVESYISRDNAEPGPIVSKAPVKLNNKKMVFVHLEDEDMSSKQARTQEILAHNTPRVLNFCKCFSPPLPVVRNLQELSMIKDRDQRIFFGSGVTPKSMANFDLQGGDNFIALDCSDLGLKAFSESETLMKVFIPTSFESFCMEAIETFHDPEFRGILKLAKSRVPDAMKGYL